MPIRSIITDHGTTVSLRAVGDDVLVILSNRGKYPDNPTVVAGCLVHDSTGFWPALFADFAMRPAVLRAIADLIEATTTEEN